MTIENLNLFAIIAMSLTCAICIALDPPAFLTGTFPHLQTVASSLCAMLGRRRPARGTGDYSIRHIVRSADGDNQYYRFTISKAGFGYRAYIDSVPRMETSLERLGARCENGRYYIDAGRRCSAVDAEMAAKNWADAQSSAMRTGPV